MKKKQLQLKQKLFLNKDVVSALNRDRITGMGNTQEECTVSRCNDQCTTTTWTLQPGCTPSATCATVGNLTTCEASANVLTGC